MKKSKTKDINYTGYFRNLPDVYGGNVCDLSQFLVINCVGWQNWMPEAHAFSVNGREDYYLLYVVNGDMKILSGEEPQMISNGQFICFYSHTPYEYHSGKDGIFYYWAHFTGHSVREILDACGIENSKVYSIGVHDEILALWRSMFPEFANQDTLFTLRTTPKLLQVLTALSERIDKDASAVVSRKLHKSIDYIHENFNREFSVGYLAELEHLSISRFYTIFKENTGYSPSEYIIVLRINRACSMFMQTDMTVKEIAMSVGYRDPFYFSRIFKKYIGKSPCEYKKSHSSYIKFVNERYKGEK